MNIFIEGKEWLKGKKTFIIAALLIILSGLEAQGYVSEEAYQLLIGVLTSLGLITNRIGSIKKK